MDHIDLNLDHEHFPRINMRYSPERIRYLLARMCQGLNLEVTETNLYAMAENLESDMERLFSKLTQKMPGINSSGRSFLPG